VDISAPPASMKKQRTILRYRVDAVPLGIVVAATALALTPFVVRLPLWILVPLWLAVVYARTFCAFAQHNHAHLPVFHRWILNRVFDAVLTMNTGYTSSMWELHHNRGHHKNFLTKDKDVAAVTYPGTDTVMSRWMYSLRGNLRIHFDSVRVGISEGRLGRKTLLPKLAFELTLQVVMTAALFYWNPILAFAFFVVPNVILAWMVWWESYPHHLNMPMTNVYDASMTTEKRGYNLVTFNIGHHTAHHEKPTLHWSLLPKRTATIRHLIHPDCIKESYATAGVRWSPLAESRPSHG
jgi:fatty acid desaturase